MVYLHFKFYLSSMHSATPTILVFAHIFVRLCITLDGKYILKASKLPIYGLELFSKIQSPYIVCCAHVNNFRSQLEKLPPKFQVLDELSTVQYQVTVTNTGSRSGAIAVLAYMTYSVCVVFNFYIIMLISLIRMLMLQLNNCLDFNELNWTQKKMQHSSLMLGWKHSRRLTQG